MRGAFAGGRSLTNARRPPDSNGSSAAAFAVGADHPELPVEHEEPEGQRFQHDLHEPLLLVHLARARGHHRLELLRVGPHRAEQARALERRRRLVGEGGGERLLLRREAVHVAPEHGEGADGLIAHDEGRGEHRAHRALGVQLRIRGARVMREVGALDGPPLLDGEPRDALADPDPDAGHARGVEVEARHRGQLPGHRVERHEPA